MEEVFLVKRVAIATVIGILAAAIATVLAGGLIDMGVAILRWSPFLEWCGGGEDFPCESTSFVVNIIGITRRFL